MDISPEQEKINLQIAGVFLPTMKKKIDHLWPTEESRAKLVHYTSAQTALEIIESKCLWMRNVKCMADYSEAQYGLHCWDQAFAEPKRKEFIAAVDEVSPGAADEAIQRFVEIHQAAGHNTYVTCFSEHLDSENQCGRLSMWRAFGANARVAIVFSVPRVSEATHALTLTLSPVAYSTPQRVAEEFAAVINSVREHSDFLKTVDPFWLKTFVVQMLLVGYVATKHQGFEEEREWRAIYQPNIVLSAHMERSIVCVGGVPQPIFKIPLAGNDAVAGLNDIEFSAIFDRLIIGPSQFQWPMFEAFADKLAAAGVKDPGSKIFISDIPIRT